MNPLRAEKLKQLKLELADAEEKILLLEHFNDNSFTAACYNDNTIADLEESTLMTADETDCKTWNISPHEWLRSIRLALELKSQAQYIANLENEIAILDD